MDSSSPVSFILEILRQEYWSGLPCPSPGNLVNPGMKPLSLTSPVLAGRFFTTRVTWEALLKVWTLEKYWVLIQILNHQPNFYLYPIRILYIHVTFLSQIQFIRVTNQEVCISSSFYRWENRSSEKCSYLPYKLLWQVTRHGAGTWLFHVGLSLNPTKFVFPEVP